MTRNRGAKSNNYAKKDISRLKREPLESDWEACKQVAIFFSFEGATGAVMCRSTWSFERKLTEVWLSKKLAFNSLRGRLGQSNEATNKKAGKQKLVEREGGLSRGSLRPAALS